MVANELTGSQLMDAQCWLWGQDIRHPDGNLLTRYGLHRGHWDTGEHNRYYWHEVGRLAVLLWSGGLLLVDASGAISLPRTGRLPHARPGARLGGAFPDPRAALQGPEEEPAPGRLAQAYRWLADYEAWVARHGSAHWREVCASRWDEAERTAARLAAEAGVRYDPLPPIPPAGLAQRWAALVP
ncbi:MAG: hypothetical protein AB7L91_13235 [Dehalococcoidia bacterium]